MQYAYYIGNKRQRQGIGHDDEELINEKYIKRICCGKCAAFVLYDDHDGMITITMMHAPLLMAAHFYAMLHIVFRMNVAVHTNYKGPSNV